MSDENRWVVIGAHKCGFPLLTTSDELLNTEVTPKVRLTCKCNEPQKPMMPWPTTVSYPFNIVWTTSTSGGNTTTAQPYWEQP